MVRPGGDARGPLSAATGPPGPTFFFVYDPDHVVPGVRCAPLVLSDAPFPGLQTSLLATLEPLDTPPFEVLLPAAEEP